MSKTIIKNRIRELRKISGMTIPQVASIMGLTRQSVADHELHKREIREKHIIKYCALFGIKLKNFLILE